MLAGSGEEYPLLYYTRGGQERKKCVLSAMQGGLGFLRKGNSAAAAVDFVDKGKNIQSADILAFCKGEKLLQRGADEVGAGEFSVLQGLCESVVLPLCAAEGDGYLLGHAPEGREVAPR